MAMMDSVHVWFRPFRDELSLKRDDGTTTQNWGDAVSPKKTAKLQMRDCSFCWRINRMPRFSRARALTVRTSVSVRREPVDEHCPRA